MQITVRRPWRSFGLAPAALALVLGACGPPAKACQTCTAFLERAVITKVNVQTTDVLRSRFAEAVQRDAESLSTNRSDGGLSGGISLFDWLRLHFADDSSSQSYQQMLDVFRATKRLDFDSSAYRNVLIQVVEPEALRTFRDIVSRLHPDREPLVLSIHGEQGVPGGLMVANLEFTPRTADQFHPVKITGLTAVGALLLPDSQKLLGVSLRPFSGMSFVLQRLEGRQVSLVVTVDGMPSVKLELDELGSGTWRRALGVYRSPIGSRCYLEEIAPGRIRVRNEYDEAGVLPKEQTREEGRWDRARHCFVFPSGSLAFWVEPTSAQSGRLVIWFSAGNAARHWEKID